MTDHKRAFVLIMLASGMLALSIIVLLRNKSPDDEMLATVGFFGACAVAWLALPPERQST